MRLPLVLMASASVLLAMAGAGLVSAQEGSDSATSSADRALLGERFTIDIEVRTADGVEVEVDPAAESWGSVEVVEVAAADTSPDGDGLVHRLSVTVTSLALGPTEVRPRVLLIEDGLVSSRELPPLAVEIAPSLPADAPPVLIGQPQPQSIAEDVRWWIAPMVVAGGITAALIVLAVVVRLLRRLLRRRKRPLVFVPAPASAQSILPEEDDALTDPVAAYRAMGAIVRSVLAERYSLPARALTTGELTGRMEAGGVDRWQARLVRGLLENCDAVVYAGYLPAADRRRADITIAHEIVEGPA